MTETQLPPGIETAPLPGWTPQLVALDLDGTCVTENLEIAPRVLDAVHAAAQRVPVVIATGRMFRSALPWAQRLGVTTPLICYQGALVREQPRDGDDGRVIAHFPLAAAAAERAIVTAREHGWHRQAYRDDRLLCEQDRPEAQLYRHISGIEIDFVDDLLVAVRDGSTKVVCVVEDDATARECERVLRDDLGGAARVVPSLVQFVEVTSLDATKANALRRICEHLGADISRTVAVGDAPNDSDMLAAAGFGVAVTGARESVLASADAVCAGPAEGGVADVLAAFGLV